MIELSKMESAIDGSFGTLLSVCGVQAIYRRGNKSIAVSTIPSTRRYDVVDGGGWATQVVSADWIIRASDLSFDGVPTLPAVGDTITVDRSGTQLVYRVIALSVGVPEWSYNDTGRTQLRVHSKLVETIR